MYDVEIDGNVRNESFDLSYIYFCFVIMKDFYNSKLF